MAYTGKDHLLNHLRDARALEVHAVRQLERVVRRPGGEEQAIYAEHLEQTREHERAIAELLEQEDQAASAVEDKTLRAGVIGLRQLADISLSTPVKLAMHMFALEHLEIATYELLCQIAERADAAEARASAQRILEQDGAAAEQVQGTFDGAVQQAEEKRGDDDGDDSLLLDQLRDVHALEQQSLALLKTTVEEICQDDELKRVYGAHLEQTEEHERLVSQRIEAHDAKPSAIRDLHLGTAKSGLHDLGAGPPDTAVKLAMNFFCLEHLEVAAYELLARIADQAGDGETAEVARRIAEEERAAAEAVRGVFERSVELMFESDASYEDVRRSQETPVQAEA